MTFDDRCMTNNNGNFIKICYMDISTIINLTTKVIYNCL